MDAIRQERCLTQGVRLAKSVGRRRDLTGAGFQVSAICISFDLGRSNTSMNKLINQTEYETNRNLAWQQMIVAKQFDHVGAKVRYF